MFLSKEQYCDSDFVIIRKQKNTKVFFKANTWFLSVTDKCKVITNTIKSESRFKGRHAFRRHIIHFFCFIFSDKNLIEIP